MAYTKFILLTHFIFVCLWKWKRLLALNHHHETKKRGGREEIGRREGRKGERKGGKEERHIFVLKVNPRNHK